jgi:transposase
MEKTLSNQATNWREGRLRAWKLHQKGWKHLASHVAGKLLVLWDGAPIHRSRVVREYLHNGAAHRIHLEQLPGYVPELNPAEGIWNYLKRIELKNLCCQSISHLNYEVRKATNRLRHKTQVILGCIKQPGFY